MRKGYEVSIRLVVLVTLLFIVATILIVSVLQPTLLPFAGEVNETAVGAINDIGGFVD